MYKRKGLLTEESNQLNTVLSGNNKHDQDAMNETFYLSNIVPQDLDNNANFWYRLEAYCRSLAKRYSDVYIVSGPLYLPKEENGKKIVKYQVSIVLRSMVTICVIGRESIELDTN